MNISLSCCYCESKAEIKLAKNNTFYSRCSYCRTRTFYGNRENLAVYLRYFEINISKQLKVIREEFTTFNSISHNMDQFPFSSYCLCCAKSNNLRLDKKGRAMLRCSCYFTIFFCEPGAWMVYKEYLASPIARNPDRYRKMIENYKWYLELQENNKKKSKVNVSIEDIIRFKKMME